MSTVTESRGPADGVTPDTTPPGGKGGRDALREMDNPHRVRAVKDVVAKVVMWFAFALAAVGMAIGIVTALVVLGRGGATAPARPAAAPARDEASRALTETPGT